MKKILGFVLILGILVVSGCVKKEAVVLPKAPEVGVLKPVTRPGTEAFRGGEKLTFLVKFWIIPAGEVSMEVREMRYRGYEVYSPLVTMKAAKLFSFFVPAGGDIRSYLDARRFYTHRYEEHFIAGRHTYERLTVYDQRNRLATYDVPVKDRMGEIKRIKKKKVRIPPNTQDILSSLYYIRTLEFEEGKVLSLNVNERKNNYQVRLKVLEKERVKTPAGSFLAWRVEPISIYKGDNLQERRKDSIYFTADKRKLPVKMMLRSKVGSATLYLINVSNHKSTKGNIEHKEFNFVPLS